MPLYEYECGACGHRFERIQKFSDPPVDTCPKCGGEVHKLMSSPAVQFKGTGWYVTDYARKETKDSKGTKDAKGAKDSTDGTTKDAKDTKAAAKGSADTKTATESAAKKAGK